MIGLGTTRRGRRGVVWSVKASAGHDRVRRGWAGWAWPGKLCPGDMRQGGAGWVWRGQSMLGRSGLGWARQAWRAMAGWDEAERGLGTAGEARLGQRGRARVCLVEARQAWSVSVRRDGSVARHGRRGRFWRAGPGQAREARNGWHGWVGLVCPGLARCGTVRQAWWGGMCQQ